jgi:hypothetical protein
MMPFQMIRRNIQNHSSPGLEGFDKFQLEARYFCRNHTISRHQFRFPA